MTKLSLFTHSAVILKMLYCYLLYNAQIEKFVRIVIQNLLYKDKEHQTVS